MDHKIPSLSSGIFRISFLIAIILVLLTSPVSADQWSIHYELDKDHYHPGDNGTLSLSYEGDMDVSVYFLSLTIVGVGIYDVTPAPPYDYKTGGNPLVVTIPFSIPVTVKPGDYPYSYEFDRGGGHPVQRGTSIIRIIAPGEPGPEQTGTNRNDSLPTPLIILVLLFGIVSGYLVLRRKRRQNPAVQPDTAGPAVPRFSPGWRRVKLGVGLAFLLAGFVILPGVSGMNPLIFILILFIPPFCIVTLPALLIALYLVVSKKNRGIDFFLIFIVVILAVLLVLAMPGIVSGAQVQDTMKQQGPDTCGLAGDPAGAVCPEKNIRLQVSNREFGPPVREYASTGGIYPVIEIADNSEYTLRVTLVSEDRRVIHDVISGAGHGGNGLGNFNTGRNLSVGNYTVEFRKGGDFLASIPITVRY
jgi:hypothetical protein